MLKSLGLWKNKTTAGHETSIVLTEEQQPIATPKMNGNGDDFLDALMEPIDPENGEIVESSTSGSGDSGCMPHWDDFQFQESLAYGPTIFKLWSVRFDFQHSLILL